MGLNANMNILQEADGLTSGARISAYGPPAVDFGRTVGMMNALFAHKLIEPFTASDFALIMICCKLSREVNQHKRDNLVDIAGYARTVEAIREVRYDEPVMMPCGDV